MIDAAAIEGARSRLPATLRRTPVTPGPKVAGYDLHCKWENLQLTGAYKARAAFSVLASLSQEEKDSGVALTSSGNFARALATAGRQLGVETTLVMMEKTAPYKVEQTRAAGGQVVFCENRYEARYEKLAELAEKGLYPIDHRTHPGVVCGHGTVGLELSEQFPEVGTVVVPVSTGGLLAGVAVAVKSALPQTRVIGVQPSGSRAWIESWSAGDLRSVEVDTVCDALTASVPGQLPFQLARHWVDEIVEVEEGTVVEAVRRFVLDSKMVVEPGAAVGLAAALEQKLPRDGPLCLVVSGGNISLSRLAQLLDVAVT